MYLTVLGISADGGDSGQLGRGNRGNGLISFNRPQSVEVHAGKNPVNHAGKIYSYFAHHVARKVYSRVNGISEVYVHLVHLGSQIGRPIGDPLMTSLKIVLERGVSLKEVEPSARAVLLEELTQMSDFTALLTTGSFYESWEQAQK